MHMIEVPDVAPPEVLHHARNSVIGGGPRQQVDVVGHQHPGVYGHFEPLRGFSQPVGVGRGILVPNETGLAVVAALDQVLRHACRACTVPSCHEASLTPSIPRSLTLSIKQLRLTAYRRFLL